MKLLKNTIKLLPKKTIGLNINWKNPVTPLSTNIHIEEPNTINNSKKEISVDGMITSLYSKGNTYLRLSNWGKVCLMSIW
jgi:hypothetical protein